MCYFFHISLVIFFAFFLYKKAVHLIEYKGGG